MQLTLLGTYLDVVGNESERDVWVITASDDKNAHTGLHCSLSFSSLSFSLDCYYYYLALQPTRSGQSSDLPSPRVALPSLTSVYDVLRLCCTARPTRGQVTTVIMIQHVTKQMSLMIQHVTKQMSCSKLSYTD